MSYEIFWVIMRVAFYELRDIWITRIMSCILFARASMQNQPFLFVEKNSRRKMIFKDLRSVKIIRMQIYRLCLEDWNIGRMGCRYVWVSGECHQRFEYPVKISMLSFILLVMLDKMSSREGFPLSRAGGGWYLNVKIVFNTTYQLPL